MNLPTDDAEERAKKKREQMYCTYCCTLKYRYIIYCLEFFLAIFIHWSLLYFVSLTLGTTESRLLPPVRCPHWPDDGEGNLVYVRQATGGPGTEDTRNCWGSHGRSPVWGACRQTGQRLQVFVYLSLAYQGENNTWWISLIYFYYEDT